MFRPVRRKEKELSREDTLLLVKEARYGTLAVQGDDGYPYAIPVNYLYKDGKIYFHSGQSGHKADALMKNDKVCFTVCGAETVKDLPWAPYVRSAVAFGRCHAVENRAQALELCRQFAEKYYPSRQMAEDGVKASGNAVVMYEIIIEHITGKELQEK